MSKNSQELQLPDREKCTTKQSWNLFKIEKNKQHVSPSVSEFSKNSKKSEEIPLKIQTNKKKKRKRIQSETTSTSSAVKLKKTKKNHIKKFPRLVFDESLNGSLSEGGLNDASMSRKPKDASSLNENTEKSQKMKKQVLKPASLVFNESINGSLNKHTPADTNPEELSTKNQNTNKRLEIRKNKLKRFIKKNIKNEKEEALAIKAQKVRENELKTTGKKDEKSKKKNKNQINKALKNIQISSVNGALEENTFYNIEEPQDLYQSEDSNYVSEDSDIDALDIKIEGLKLQDIFQPATSVYLADAHPLNIPKKHFKFCENDLEPDLKMFEKEIEYDKQHCNAEEHTELSTDVIQSTDIDENNFETQEFENGTENLNESTNIHSEKDDENYFETQILENTENYTENTFEEQSIAEETENALFEEQQDFNSFTKIMLKNNELLVILNAFRKINLYGFFTIKVLQGQLEIFGTTLDSKSTEKKVYSNRGSALLYLQNSSDSQEVSFRDIKTLVDPELLYEVDKTLLIPATSAVVLCKKLKEPFIKFIEQHIPQVLFPIVDNDGPRVEFEPRGAWNYLKTDTYWTQLTQDLSRASKVAICGGKGVGKSTFLRYCLNRLVQRFGKVLVVDLDPGQSEFTVPGCISIVEVKEEIFGSNFTHHLPFEKSLLSSISVGYDIYKYLKTVKTLLKLLPGPDPAFFNNFPTLYNLCGYHKGLGLDLTMQVLNLIKPTTLVQINSTNRNKNYLFDLTPVNLKLKLKHCDLELDYEFFALDSQADTQKSSCWNMQARTARDINILAYLGRIMSENVTSLTSNLIDVYSINLSSLKIKDSEGNTISPLAINANFLALCSVFETNNEFLVHGWGFVRGIDIKNDILVLVTPENMVDELYQVDHLVLTSNTVVASLLMSPGEIRGHVPYVAEGTLSKLGQLTKRSYLPPNRR